MWNCMFFFQTMKEHLADSVLSFHSQFHEKFTFYRGGKTLFNSSQEHNIKANKHKYGDNSSRHHNPPLLPTYFPHLFSIHFPHAHLSSVSLPPSFGLLLPHLLSNASIFLSLFSTVGENYIWSSLNKDLQSLKCVSVCGCLFLSRIKNIWNITCVCCRTYKQMLFIIKNLLMLTL